MNSRNGNAIESGPVSDKCKINNVIIFEENLNPEAVFIISGFTTPIKSHTMVATFLIKLLGTPLPLNMFYIIVSYRKPVGGFSISSNFSNTEDSC